MAPAAKVWTKVRQKTQTPPNRAKPATVATAQKAATNSHTRGGFQVPQPPARMPVVPGVFSGHCPQIVLGLSGSAG